MITFMFNLAADSFHDMEPHQSASYKYVTDKCNACNHIRGNYLHVPGNIEKFDTKEQMLERITDLAGDLWDKAEEIAP